MKRRRFFTLLGGLTAHALSLGTLSSPLRAQQRMHRVGVLFPAGHVPGARNLAEALAGLGYIEGRDIVYDIREAGSRVDRLPDLARAIVAGEPDVIVSATATAATALTDATHNIPIIMALVGNPIGLGLTGSMARPTRNVTGFTTGHDTLAAKRLELLLELVPAARKIALLWVPTNAQHKLVEERTRQATAAIKLSFCCSQ